MTVLPIPSVAGRVGEIFYASGYLKTWHFAILPTLNFEVLLWAQKCIQECCPKLLGYSDFCCWKKKLLFSWIEQVEVWVPTLKFGPWFRWYSKMHHKLGIIEAWGYFLICNKLNTMALKVLRKKRTFCYFSENLERTNQNISLKLNCAKIWCIVLC